MNHEICERCNMEILGQLFNANNKTICLLCYFKHTALIIDSVMSITETVHTII